jgi:hypothetical protein
MYCKRDLCLWIRATSQYPATGSLDIDDGVHDDSLAERFGDLLVRLPDDPGSGDGLKLDKGSTATLKRSLEQSESSPLDNTPSLGLDHDGDIGNATNDVLVVGTKPCERGLLGQQPGLRRCVG